MQFSSTKTLGSVVPLNKNVNLQAPICKSRKTFKVKADKEEPVVQPINGDPFIGMFETPVTSSAFSANWLSNLPIYRYGVKPLYRGVEVGLVHGYFIPGPFIKLGPLRNIPEVADQAGCLAGAGLIVILTVCLALYGAVTFQESIPQVGLKTLSGRSIQRDELFSTQGWNEFTAGWFVGGISGVLWCYILTQTLPYYS